MRLLADASVLLSDLNTHLVAKDTHFVVLEKASGILYKSLTQTTQNHGSMRVEPNPACATLC